MFESGGKRGGFAEAGQVVGQFMSFGDGEIRDRGDEVGSGSVAVLHEGVGDSGFIGEITGDVAEDGGDSVGALDGEQEIFERLGKQSLLSAGGDHFIGIAGEDGEDFGAVGGTEIGAGGADGKFALTRGAIVAQVFDNFRAESFRHWPASNRFY